MALVQIVGIVCAKPLHGPRNAGFRTWRDQQMDVIRHQDPRMQCNVIPRQRVIEKRDKGLAINFARDDGILIVTAHDDVLRVPGKKNSRSAWQPCLLKSPGVRA